MLHSRHPTSEFVCWEEVSAPSTISASISFHLSMYGNIGSTLMYYCYAMRSTGRCVTGRCVRAGNMYLCQGSDPLRCNRHGKAVGIIRILTMVVLNGIVGQSSKHYRAICGYGFLHGCRVDRVSTRSAPFSMDLTNRRTQQSARISGDRRQKHARSARRRLIYPREVMRWLKRRSRFAWKQARYTP